MTAKSIKDNLNSAVSSGYVSEAWAELIPESTSYSLYYHLRDNPRINAIDFRGASLYSRDELLRLVDCRPGMVSNHLLLRSDVKTLEKFYIENGYTLARVSTEFDDKTGLLTFKIDEGRINAVGIEGNRKTRRWVISRNIPFRAGDLFVQRKAEKAVEDIYSTGLFETAKLNIYPDSAGITLVARVEEKPYDYVRAGARFDLEYKSRAFVDLVADNVFGGGQSFFLSTTIGEKKRSVSLNYHVDRIFSSLFTSTARVDFTEFKRNHYEHHSYEGYFKQESYGGDIMPGRQIPQLGAISFVASLRKFIWRQPGREGEIEFTKLGLGVRSLVDSRDAISFADVGKVHFFELEFASDIRNEKTAYTRFYTSLESYYRVTRRFNFHPRLALGASSDFMPYFDEFSLGGLNRFLGLHEDEYLGDKLVVVYLELRQKVGDRFFIMGRYDAGNVWNKLERVKLSTLRHGGGLGVGMKTPLGPAQLWYGRTTKGLDSFYLDIGYDW
jgi:outer membrane protein insertion porin family